MEVRVAFRGCGASRSRVLVVRTHVHRDVHPVLIGPVVTGVPLVRWLGVLWLRPGRLPCTPSGPTSIRRRRRRSASRRRRILRLRCFRRARRSGQPVCVTLATVLITPIVSIIRWSKAVNSLVSDRRPRGGGRAARTDRTEFGAELANRPLPRDRYSSGAPRSRLYSRARSTSSSTSSGSEPRRSTTCRSITTVWG